MVTAISEQRKGGRKYEAIQQQSDLLGDYRARTVAAIAGCVAGDTLIDCPNGAHRIDSLLGFNQVLSLTDAGIRSVTAFIFCKGKTKLYRITLDNGQTIEATANHYLLVSDGQIVRWCSVGELMPMLTGQKAVFAVSVEQSNAVPEQCGECLPGLRESMLEFCQPTQSLDAQHWFGVRLNYGGCYSGDSYLCGGQLHWVADNDRQPFPLSIGAHEYNHPKSKTDGRGISLRYNHPYQSYGPLARNNLIPLTDHDSSGEYHVLPSPCELSQGHDSRHVQGHRLTSDSQLLTSLDSLFQPVSNSYDVPYQHLQSLLSHKLVNIASIEPTAIDNYYDMVVPKYHNYLANGMVHHNTGGGKTSMGYWWLLLRMDACPGYGWGICEPTYSMLSKIILNSPDPERPDLITWLKQEGIYKDYKAVDRIIETTLGKIYLGSADNPDSMQGPALKGYWLDEAGMMSLIAYQTALQRVSFYDGQVLLSTTPYNRGWLKTEVADKADNDYIHVEKWRSIDNPKFPAHVYYEMRDGPNAMQRHRFSMMFDAEFDRPVGMIYSSFNSDKCVIEPFRIPQSWPRYVGVDYGPVNTAVIWFAKSTSKHLGWPVGTMFAYREYLAGNKSIGQHVTDLKKLGKGEPIERKVASGVASERQWRREYSEKGWHLQECRINDVELGIDRVWAMHRQNKLVYFNTLRYTLSQKEEYRRKLDESQEPTDTIENKEQFHFMDAERYIIADLSGRRPIFEV